MTFNTLISTRKSVTIFKTIEEFVSDNVDFDDLVLGNFKSLFVIYYSFLVLILIVWLISRARQRSRLKFRLRRLRL